jgi:hypothetical protein
MSAARPVNPTTLESAMSPSTAKQPWPAKPESAEPAVDSPAWWRLPIVWMVIGGPAIVVVASFTTLALAILNPDPVLEAPPPRVAGEVPAMQARNHAAAPQR